MQSNSKNTKQAYRTLKGIDLPSNKLLEAKDCQRGGDHRIDGGVGNGTMTALPNYGGFEASRSGEEWSRSGADGAHRRTCVDVHTEDSVHVVKDAFLQHVVGAGMALLRRLED